MATSNLNCPFKTEADSAEENQSNVIPETTIEDIGRSSLEEKVDSSVHSLIDNSELAAADSHLTPTKTHDELKNISSLPSNTLKPEFPEEYLPATPPPVILSDVYSPPVLRSKENRKRRNYLQSVESSLYEAAADVLDDEDDLPRHARKKRSRFSKTVPEIIANETVEDLKPEDLQSQRSGVYFHVPKREWRAVIGRGTKRQQKTFSVRKYGFSLAKQQAEYYRAQFDDTGTVYDSRRGEVPPNDGQPAANNIVLPISRKGRQTRNQRLNRKVKRQPENSCEPLENVRESLSQPAIENLITLSKDEQEDANLLCSLLETIAATTSQSCINELEEDNEMLKPLSNLLEYCNILATQNLGDLHQRDDTSLNEISLSAPDISSKVHHPIAIGQIAGASNGQRKYNDEQSSIYSNVKEEYKICTPAATDNLQNKSLEYDADPSHNNFNKIFKF